MPIRWIEKLIKQPIHFIGTG